MTLLYVITGRDLRNNTQLVKLGTALNMRQLMFSCQKYTYFMPYLCTQYDQQFDKDNIEEALNEFRTIIKSKLIAYDDNDDEENNMMQDRKDWYCTPTNDPQDIIAVFKEINPNFDEREVTVYLNDVNSKHKQVSRNQHIQISEIHLCKTS